MPIDQCQHSFGDLSRIVLPEYMRQLRVAMRNPWPLSGFAVSGRGVAAILREMGKAEDFSGCYVLMEAGKPIYVGISRCLVSRLRQHVNARTHYSASLAYRIAADRLNHSQSRDAAMRNPEFLLKFNEAQRYLRGLDVAFIEIFNPLELYIFEAFCAMELDTAKWNTFETH